MRKLCRAVVYRHPVVVGVLALGLIAAGSSIALTTSSEAQTTLVRVLPPSAVFDEPWSICSNGTNVWVPNNLGNTVTELNASTGAVVQTLSGSNYALYFPQAVSCDGAHVWIVSQGPNTADPNSARISEVDGSTGALVRVIQGASFGFDGPEDISSDGTDVWVVNQNNNSVTEIDAATGNLVQSLSDSSYGFDYPKRISSDGTHVWVSNANNSVTEIDASSGALVGVLSGSSLGVNGTFAINSDGTHVWVPSQSTLAELDASTGALVQVISGSNYGFNNPNAVSSDGTHVWVANSNNSVTEIDAATGALVRVISGSSYAFSSPYAISSDSSHVWVVNFNNNTVTEIDAATGVFVQVIGSNTYGIANPYGVSSDGTHVWVANYNSNSVSEIDAATGALVQILSDPSYGFSYPHAIDSDGTHVWVANQGSNTVSELNAATGALVQVLPASSYGFNVPEAISSDGSHVWVTNEFNSSVTEINASTGALVQVIGSNVGLAYPYGVSSDGTHVWIANNQQVNGYYSVTELDATTGALVEVLSAPGDRFFYPSGISSDGTHVWVTNNYVPTSQYSVTELDASTGRLVQVISGPSYGLGGPADVTSDGSHVWITNYVSNNVTELDATTGSLVQVLTGSSYGFNYPRGVSSDGTNVWIANTHSNSIIELSGGPSQAISFTSTPPTDAQVGGSPYTLAATGGASGNPVVFSVDPAASSVCSVSGQSVSFIGAGTCMIDANQDAGNGYPAADQVQQSFVVGTQLITFTSATPPDAQVGGDPYLVTVTGGGSGNPVGLSIDGASGSVCSISGQSVSFLGAGTCTIDANQAGNSDYLAAPQVQQSFLVGDPVITFTSTPPAGAAVRGPTYDVTATGAPSGLPVVFSSATTAVCTVTGSTVSFVSAGTCTIDANQAGNALYLPSTGAQSFPVSNVQAIRLCTNTTATVGSTYTCVITTTGSPVPLLKRIGKLPGGLTFVNNHDGSATISGIPRAKTGGSYSPQVEAVFGSVTTQTLSLTVDEAPAFISRASKTAHVGVVLSTLIRTRGYPTAAISVSPGTLPSGVTLTDNGNGTAFLAGTPASGSAGVYNFTIGASNGIGNPAQQSFELIVRA
jgi:DNA-binding beta-propeller fold protein YncE